MSIRSVLIATDLPTPDHGPGQRLLSLRTALAAAGECRFVWLAPEGTRALPASADYLVPSPLPDDGRRGGWLPSELTELRPHPPALEGREAIRREFPFDLAVCHLFRSTVAAPLDRVPCLLDADRLPEPEGRLPKLLWPMTRRAMNRRATAFDTVFVIRSADGPVLEDARTELLPAISATAGPPVDPDREARHVLFVGSMSSEPNREAAELLATTVAPRLLAADSGCIVRLVGAGTEAFAGMPGVSAVGYVEDLAEEYRRARVVACPTWRGVGGSVKLAEALQLGCAILASPHAADGFRGLVVPGRSLRIARSPELFSASLLELLADEGSLLALRREAREVAGRFLGQRHISRIVRRVAERAVRSRDAAPSAQPREA
ncbi:MAG: glycosyltransferase [Sandaracinaceae bacterium]